MCTFFLFLHHMDAISKCATAQSAEILDFGRPRLVKEKDKCEKPKLLKLITTATTEWEREKVAYLMHSVIQQLG